MIGQSEWLESGAALLREDDPGPTPFLVDELVVDPSILAIVGSHKVGKTWALLEMAVSIATGLPAFGFLKVRRGPVILFLEESGRSALHRRLAQICRGRGIAAAELEHLHFAANQRVRLHDENPNFALGSWPERICRAVDEIRPVAVFFDPLARVKGSLDENSQQEMAPALEFMREMRDRGQCTVGFVQHEGHGAGGRMRGTSDLEAYWESKVVIRRDGKRCELNAEHREAEPSERISYHLNFDSETRSLRIDVDRPDGDADLTAEILAFLFEHPGSTKPQLLEAIPRRAKDTRSRLADLVEAGTVNRKPSEQRDRRGRARTVDLYFPASEADPPVVPLNGTGGNGQSPGPLPSPSVPALIAGTGTGDDLEGVGS